MTTDVRIEEANGTVAAYLKEGLKIGKMQQVFWTSLLGAMTLLFVWKDLIDTTYPHISLMLVFFGLATIGYPLLVNFYWNKFGYLILKNKEGGFLIAWPERYNYRDEMGIPPLSTINENALVIVNEPLLEIIAIKRVLLPLLSFFQPTFERFLIVLRFSSRSVNIGGNEKSLNGLLKKINVASVDSAYAFRKEDVEKIAATFKVPLKFE